MAVEMFFSVQRLNREICTFLSLLHRDKANSIPGVGAEGRDYIFPERDRQFHDKPFPNLD